VERERSEVAVRALADAEGEVQVEADTGSRVSA
jgi:hypothetical protein